MHDPSQVLYLPFDKDDGSYARDRSGYGNHGVIYGATRVAGKVGGALSFDGVDDYGLIPTSPVLDGMAELTILLWVKPVVMPTGLYRPCISKWASGTNYAYWLGFFDKYPHLQVFGTTEEIVRSTVALSINTWYHLAGVWDGSDAKIYVNGEPQPISVLKNGAGSVRTTTGNVRIARYNTTYSAHQYDEIRIYNRALSQAEIQRIMNMRGI